MTEPYTIAVPQAVLDDLHRRIDQTRWPEPSPWPAWAQGTDLAYLRGLVDYWRKGFDWRRSEAELNGFSQFQAPVDGLRLHFIHQRSSHAHARPLLLVHGWPGSVYEFHTLVPRLTQPERFGGDAADAFHVVAPSLPGYAFSEAPRQAGESPRAMAKRFHSLMSGTLGYSRYGAQGGDWGATITSWLAFDQPAAVAGLHLNMPGLTGDLAEGPLLEPEEMAYLADWEKQRQEEFGYMIEQGSRPQSLAYGLTDSPVGLAGWLVEKYRAWSDCSGNPEEAISRDEMLTLITLYWVTNSIGTSVRLYHEHRRAKDRLPPDGRVEVPVGFADFPKEILRAPRLWVERAYNIVQWTSYLKGGHFAALEQPDVLAQDIARFFRGVWKG